ncbi:MAG: hypothetical protein ACLQVY_26245 [Limisphaerales bacterium]
MIGGDLIEQARQTSRQLIPYLPRPNVFSIVRRAGVTLPPVTVFSEPEHWPAKHFPVAVFDDLGAIKLKELPVDWAAAYRQWKVLTKAAATLRRSFETWGKAMIKGASPDLTGLDAVSAGILLLAEGTQTVLGQELFRRAASDPVGAFLAAQAVDLALGEMEQILETLSSEPEFLFWLGHQQPRFRATCHMLASVFDSLHAGLAAAQNANFEWFQHLLETARTSPTAACTALVLLPQSSPFQRARWLENISIEPRWAYEAARWTMHTWPGGRWLNLRQQLRRLSTSDKGRWWYNWFRFIEPDPRTHFYAGVDSLWHAELITDLGLPSFPAQMRRRLWRQYTINRGDRGALMLLRWCQTRRRL